MGMYIGSIVTFCVHKNSCNTDIQVAVGLVAGLWVCIFLMLLLQVIGMVKCLKAYPKTLFVFYFFIVAVIYISMMMLFGGEKNNCRTEAPSMWYWLIINVCMFYLICAFGLASWGQYLCSMADHKEEVT